MTEYRPITSRVEWLRWRRDFLTASDVPAAAGVDRFKTRLRLFMEKTELVPDIVETSAMRRGRHFETAALAYLQEEHPDWTIERPNVFIADTENRLGATPDAWLTVAGCKVNCQIKTVSRPVFERWDGKAPLGYQLQVVTENLLSEADSGLLAVLAVSAHDAELHCFDIPRHPAAEENIRQIARQFWADVEEGRRPPADYSRDAEQIAALFPHAVPDTILDLSGDNRLPKQLARRDLLKRVISRAGERVKLIDNEIKDKMGAAEVAELPGWKITWKDTFYKGYTKVVPESTRRDFRVWPRKEEEA
jgi:putative phage-type endonuclease